MSNDKHWPAGSPGGVGGEFAPKEGGGGSGDLKSSWPTRDRISATAGMHLAMEKKRAHRATGNKKGRPVGSGKKIIDEYGQEISQQEFNRRNQAFRAATPVPPDPMTTVPANNPYKGLTGDKHTDRQLAGVATQAAGTLVHGAAAVGLGYALRKVNDKIAGVSGSDTGVSSTAARAAQVLSNGMDMVTGHHVYDPGVGGGVTPAPKNPVGRPPGSTSRTAPAFKATIGFTGYRKPIPEGKQKSGVQVAVEEKAVSVGKNAAAGVASYLKSKFTKS